jgi:glycosyltransferase involved in cell wall biosynthesis
MLKIWFRIKDLSVKCSWSFVYESLKKAFLENNIILHTEDTPPKDIEDYVELWWTDPRFWEWSKLPVKMRVGIALSEAHSFITKGKSIAINNLQLCDLLIIPTEFSAVAYREAPLDVPIVIIPFGVDNSIYKYIKRDWSKTINYLHYGVAQFRKGSWLVPEGFIKAFTKPDNVHLTISSFRTAPEYQQLEREYGKHPKITFSDKMVDNSIDVYKDHHILVSPHISEGWGLCIPEAMSTGMSCLVSRCSSPLEYFNKDYGWWIEMSDHYVPVSKCLDNTSGFWRLPDIDSLVNCYKLSYNNINECIGKGKKASEFVLNNLTWQQTAQKIVKAIENSCSTIDICQWK